LILNKEEYTSWKHFDGGAAPKPPEYKALPQVLPVYGKEETPRGGGVHHQSKKQSTKLAYNARHRLSSLAHNKYTKKN